MNTLRVLTERINDARLQRLATKLYKAFLDGLPTANIALAGGTMVPGYVLRIKGRGVFKHVTDVPKARALDIEIPVIPYAQSTLFKLTPPKHGVEYVLTWRPSVFRAPTGAKTLTGLSLAEVREYLARTAKRDRNKLLHELTHFLDFVRMGDEALRRASRTYTKDTEDLTRYSNDPTEMNAYFQEIAASKRDDFERDLYGSDPVWDLAPWLDLSTKDAVESFTDRVDREVWNHLTERNKRRFRKRAAMFYDELHDIALAKLDDLAKAGDEDAVYALRAYSGK